MTDPQPMSPELEAALVLAPDTVRAAVQAFVWITEHFVERVGHFPTPDLAQRYLLAALARVGGSADDVRFLIVHELAEPQDLEHFIDTYPHAAGVAEIKETRHG